MSEPKNHHYIPQAYLRNFAEKRKKEDYVFVQFRGEKFHWTNIRNICSETYFYSIPNISEDKKNIIENYYANHIDNTFPEITEILTDDSCGIIDLSTRRKIITSALSLYFRTPRFLNAYNTHLQQLLAQLKDYILGNTEVHTISFFGKLINLQNLNFEELESEIKQQNKIFFLKEHIEVFNAFVDYKINDGIGIKKIIDDYEFITSDNPVIIRNSSEGFSNLFDPTNIIHLPINHKYLLSIAPKAENDLANTFNRIEGRFQSVLVINVDIEKNSQNWIIGSEKSIHNHLSDQINFNEMTPANEKLVSDTKEEAKLMRDLYGVLERSNGIITEEFIVKLKELSNHDLFKDDPNVSRNIKELREKGYSI